MDEKIWGVVGTTIGAGLLGGFSLLRRQHKAMKANLEAKEGNELTAKKITEAAGDIVKHLKEHNEWLDKQLKQANIDIDKVRKEYIEIKAKFEELNSADIQKVLAENALLKAEIEELRKKFEQTERDFMAVMKRIVQAEPEVRRDFSD
jgi:predicted RNase H-like nuclease (RuvC/YqgF family)